MAPLDDRAPPPGEMPELPESGGGRLVENILHFARVLRAAGLPVGPGKVMDAIEAVRTVGITDREVFYWTLHAVFVNRRDQREIFDQAFHIFWRNPRILEKMMQMVLPEMQLAGDANEEDAEKISRRVSDALSQQQEQGEDASAPDREQEQEIQLDAVMTYSDEELLQGMDFEKMSAEEIRAARRAIEKMHLPLADIPTRRFSPSPYGRRVDLRNTLRQALRSGGDIIPLQLKKRRMRPPPLVTLCDISGSMTRYSRMLLHFMHTLTNDRDRVHTFLFGTRLTNVTRYLRHKDVDEALDKISASVEDWSGGTRIGHCLHDFNRHWSRRVLTQGAVVLLITDGLDREAGKGLGAEMERLHKSCRRLIWLNPLLRYDGFAPKSMGVRALLPHVDEFRPVHSLDSLEDLAKLLGEPAGIRRKGMGDWLGKLAEIEAAETA
ncbi:VWA domain-containing protein [Nisaea acidiphila]|uniref:VWA domain-containing protein n=1 Tax=Nisaea acidiphila TaxID=1862145 RepID=A0A9J7AXY4_9PROT|nr:VWA domain-containing protein [Nisaea acidiphila]UUX50285.1 VWA domain-containing protein [Nisaea acidiphila]